VNWRLDVWNTNDGTYQSLTDEGSGYSYINFSPDGSLLAVGPTFENQPTLMITDDGTEVKASGVEVWENKTWKHLRTLSDANPPYVFSPDGKTLATGSGVNAMISLIHPGPPVLWDIATGARRELVIEGYPGALDFSPDGKLLAVNTSRVGDGSGGIVGRDGTALLNLETGQIQRFIKNNFLIRFSPDGSLLAMRPATRDIRLWDVHNGAMKRIVHGDTQNIWDYEFSPDGRLLAASTYGQVLLWDVTG
jgi:WD40 repeat protein